MSPCPFSFFARALCLHLGGDKRVRTADPLLAKQVLSQLSYTPVYSLSSSLLLSASFFNGSHSRRFPVTPRSPPLLRKKFLDNRKVPQNFVLLPTLLLSASFFRASALGASNKGPSKLNNDSSFRPRQHSCCPDLRSFGFFIRYSLERR